MMRDMEANKRFMLEMAILLSLGALLSITFALLVYPAFGWPSIAPMPIRTVVLAIAVWLLIRSAGERLLDFGLQWPQSIWLAAVLVLAFFGAKLFLAQPLSDAITDWLKIPRGDHSTFDHLRGNASALVGWLVAAWLAGGLAEEFIFRGYLMKRVADLLGGGAGSWTAALILQALAFGSMHFYLGVGGMISAMIGAMFFGFFFLLSRRNLWPVIVVHGLWDSLVLVLIYARGIPST